VHSIGFDGNLVFNIYLDSDVRNEDTNYGMKFWKEVNSGIDEDAAVLVAATHKTDYHVAAGMTFEILSGRKQVTGIATRQSRKNYVSFTANLKIAPGQNITIYKYVSVLSSLNHPKENLSETARQRALDFKNKGFKMLLSDHISEWARIWSEADVKIEGDVAAQQAIRFNIFQLNQTYTGKDERLNVGPKGFTGEKYGGSTYWDTEAFVLPFFLKTAGQMVPRNLLLYRYRHLQKSIENAGKLGFSNGAALYPMVTMNGEECHNEWEITFEEIHRNGAVAYAIYNYIRHTGDDGYMADYGLEVLIGISRFWNQRMTWSEDKKKYVILGVTGPNEYENNVNNNWYTNTLAKWTIDYTLKSIGEVGNSVPDKLEKIFTQTGFDSGREPEEWKNKAGNLHFPFDEKRKIFLQQDGFLDKELKPASGIPLDERPLNQHWSWDRILRSCFIKQADVLQGLYMFEDNFDAEAIKRHFDFYEPMTVHESSLSACVHSVIASVTCNIRKAYELYLRTARLDLDDYNHEAADGLHITSMAGTWLAIVEGFGGMRISDNSVVLKPLIPEQWVRYSFHARFRGVLFEVIVTALHTTVKNLSEKPLVVNVYGDAYTVSGQDSIIINSSNNS
jgi:maltose phosphorylase